MDLAVPWCSADRNVCLTKSRIGPIRIYLGYHTAQQVVVGAVVGAIFGWLVRRLYHVCPFFASFASKSE